MRRPSLKNFSPEFEMNWMSESAMIAMVFVAYFAAAFVWPTVRIWRLTQLNPYVLPSSDDVYGFVTVAMRALMLSLLAYITGQLIWPDIERDMGALPWLMHAPAQIAGWTGIAVAILWTIVAQAQMGRSWRIGIDTNNTTALVTSGLFARSRNPIFLAMRVCLFSLVLIRPNAVTLVLWLVGDVIMQVQVRLEEAFLQAQHGDSYRAYSARTRRWI
jgi:protein-S-isoprenylcysteine O-methyltransferase Ste14